MTKLTDAVPTTEAQKKAIEYLWFVYGNGGVKHTMGNHKFLQRHVEGRHDEAKFHQPSDECVEAFEKVCSGDFSGLSKGQRKVLDAVERGML